MERSDRTGFVYAQRLNLKYLTLPYIVIAGTKHLAVSTAATFLFSGLRLEFSRLMDLTVVYKHVYFWRYYVKDA